MRCRERLTPPPASPPARRFAVGALLAGVLADLVSIEAAIYAVAALMAASGIVVVIACTSHIRRGADA